MFDTSDKHCRECICPTCTLFQTEECLDGNECCMKCENDSHTAECPFYGGEE